MRTPSFLAPLSALLLGLLLAAGCGSRAPLSHDLSGTAGSLDFGAGPLDPSVDHDGDRFTVREGDCDDRDPSSYPGAAEVCDHRDNDCDGKIDESCDWDEDNYTPEAGDCNDEDKLINPGAYEVGSNQIDDDCDGLIDEIIDRCDGNLDRRPNSMAGAFELCPSWIVKSDWTHESAEPARAVLRSFGSLRPRAGNTFAVLSTGVAAAEKDPGYVDPQPGTEFQNDARNPLPMPQLSNKNICGQAYADELVVHDYLELTYSLRVPTNARSFSFQFYFLSAEYPEWVGSEFNDKFLVLLDSRAYKGNISYDQNKNPITVNVGFFQVCQSAAICEGQKRNSCSMPVNGLAGTGYSLDDGSGLAMGGGTGWLTTTAPVSPGETATLRFILFDEGDHILDSTVLLDNFQWQLTPAMAPETIP